MEPLKNRYNQAFFDHLAGEFKIVHPAFDESHFMALVFDEAWDNRELKPRMRHIAECLRKVLPDDYATAIEILKPVAAKCSYDYMYVFFPDFVELYGQDDWETSMAAMEHFTQFSSAEFAVRPFIMVHPKKMMEQMMAWASHENHHVRRLSSEGCRPLLPWGMALTEFKKDPAPILPVLEKLKADPSEYVRKSVANNLNDIAKHHPAKVIEVAKRWHGKQKDTDWIVKHACRTLLKQGNSEAMRLFGFGDPSNLHVKKLKVSKSKLAIGDSFVFDFELENKTKNAKVRLEFNVYYMKSNGKMAPKIFQISEREYGTGQHAITKTHSFEERSTRKHYPGAHQIGIVVNGIEKAVVSFELTK